LDFERLTDGALGGCSVAASPETPARFYAPQIDGLRFIAALLVIIHHAPPLPYLHAVREIGWIGVDLFLCISAYLLTRLIRLEYQRTGDIRIRNFLIRRALRIWPLYFGYAVVMCLAGFVVFSLPARVSGSWVLAHLSFSANFMTAFKGFSPVPFTSHLWTLSLEEQAYFVIPFVLLAISRRPPRTLILLVALAAALLILTLARLGFWTAGLPTDAIFVLPTRADALVLGAGVALLFEDRKLPSVPILSMCILVIVLPYLLAGATLQGTLLVSLYPLVGVTCAMVLLLSLRSERLKSALSWRPIRYFGKISYGIYVYHLLCISIAAELLARLGMSNPVVALSATIALTLTFAAASYHLYESYFLRLKERFTIVPSRAV
jgi:peptidoglycan/LPS O-acetylase OafA/YrhL